MRVSGETGRDKFREGYGHIILTLSPADAHHQAKEAELIDNAPFNPEELTPEGISIRGLCAFCVG